ncbi:MAG: peptidase S14 [Burkholderiales bacterium]|nr:MAG: peptidase S14 [Burkholderiales bacterium]
MRETLKIPKLAPDLRLFGSVGDAMLAEFFRQQGEAPQDGPIVFELSSDGGDADLGRRIAQELRLWQENDGREVWFLGKTYVFSAGVTIMSAIPRDRRFLTRDCEVLIHERKMKKDIRLDGALRGCRSTIQDVLAEIESGQRLERDGFAQLVKGTTLKVEDIENRVMEKDWYLTAHEALEIGLVGGVV